jgi:hypothetical protein
VGFLFFTGHKADNILIRPETHLSPYEMYHEETPKWINFLRACEKIAIMKTPAKLQAKLTNRGIPGVYLGPTEDHKGDTYTFWIPSLNTFLNHAQQCFWIKPTLIFIR